MTDYSPLTNAQTSRYRRLKRGKYRKEEQLFLLEGVRLCQDALRSDLTMDCVIIEKGFDKLQVPQKLNILEANKTQIEQISDSSSPQGIICIAHIPIETPLPVPGQAEIVLVLDCISDPGNTGTIFRSALWFGVDHVLLGPGCVDPYSPKVVRSSMGAIAGLQIHQTEDLIASAQTWQQAGGALNALHMDGKPLQELDIRQPLFLIIGSEAHGVNPELLEMSQNMSIEKRGAGESLNAAMATSIALYELANKRGAS